MAGGGAGPIVVVMKKRTLSSTGYMKSVKQLATDPNNEWKVDRILVLNTLTPSSPPLSTEIAVAVALSEFIGMHTTFGMQPITG